LIETGFSSIHQALDSKLMIVVSVEDDRGELREAGQHPRQGVISIS
jgi:hypothetical protein